MDPKPKGLDRRSFIKRSAAGFLGGGLAAGKGYSRPQDQETADFPRIKEYRTLGRTGFKVSDLGTGDFEDPGPFRAMLDAGVNYIDTSESYGQHGRKIGEAIQGLNRSSLFITSKFQADASIRSIGKEGVTKDGFIRRAQRVMDALKTDYLDCFMLSMPETVEALDCEGYHAAADLLKKEGKARFTGVSHHGSQWILSQPKQTMGEVLLAAARDGRFDVILLAYNFLKEDESERILEVSAEKGIGTTLMKTNPIRTYNWMKEWLERNKSRGRELSGEEKSNIARYEKKVENAQTFIKRHGLETEQEIRSAAVRFVLSNPHVNTVCLTVLNYDEARNALVLSGSRLEERDRALLSAYREECGELYCRHACGLCEPACPHGIPINTIMRFDHYFEAQGREKHALAEYSRLKTRKADACESCAGPCEAACPYGVPVRSLLCSAHLALSLQA